MVIKCRRKYIVGSLLLLLLILGYLNVYNWRTASKNVFADGDQPIYVPIIMYHEIKTFKTGKDVILPNEFESDLQYLHDQSYNTITMTQLINYVNGSDELPDNPIILTFDDGYLNTYEYAFPLIKEYEMKIVISIIGKNSDDFTRIPDDNLDYSHVTWDQLNEMQSSGYVEVQNHSYNLHSREGKNWMPAAPLRVYRKI